ncbi:MAG: MBL fold metallo-hydrolase [Panacagrimonas sp.]
MQARIQAFFDPATSTVSYVVSQPDNGACAVIDPVLDYDPKSARVSSGSADLIANHIREQALNLEWILETHAHADHLSGAYYLKQQLGGRIGIGRQICQVQARFAALFDLGDDFPTDGSQFDHLLEDGERIRFGGLSCDVLHTPGHTPACVSYKIGDALFVGDTIFMPDYGTARADFPGGDARALYRSIRRILDFPEHTRLMMCHDYQPDGRAPRWESTVGEQAKHNQWIASGVREDDFVRRRKARDATLAAPVLILPSLQVNIRAGRLPAAAANGIRYLQIPLNQLGGS